MAETIEIKDPKGRRKFKTVDELRSAVSFFIHNELINTSKKSEHIPKKERKPNQLGLRFNKMWLKLEYLGDDHTFPYSITEMWTDYYSGEYVLLTRKEYEQVRELKKALKTIKDFTKEYWMKK